MKPTAKQSKAIEFLWFVYGNGGPKHNMQNHKFLQRHVEGRHDEAKFHQPDKECVAAFERVMADDFSDFNDHQMLIINSAEERERWKEVAGIDEEETDNG